MKKKLAIFTHGGIGTSSLSQGFPLITQIVNRLADDFEITVFSLSTFNPEFHPKNYRAVCVPGYVSPQLFRWVYFIALFFKNYYRNRFQVLYSFWGYPMGTLLVLCGKIIRRPSVVNILGAESANILEINYGHLRNYSSRKLVLWTCRQASELIAVSNYQLVTLKQYGMLRHAKVIPWGADEKIFKPSVKELTLPLKLLHVANLTAVKDQETLIKAFHLISQKIPAKLRIIGPDFLDGKIQRFVSELALENDVEFMGFILNKDIVKHCHWADAFILTSLSEGQNNSITEAMMSGLLPVSTSVGIMHDLGNAVGVVVQPRDFESLANQLIELYSTPQEWKQKQHAAHSWAMKHNIAWTINQTKDVINNVVL